MLRALAPCLILLCIPACGDDGHAKPKDAAIDVPGDGKCPAGQFFTGELVDWASTETDFCGVFNATFTVTGSPNATDKTSPNGRFEVCLPSAGSARVDISMSTDASGCSSLPGHYMIPGIAVANMAVIASGKEFSARALTMEKFAAFFTSVGVTYDAARAQVFVHVEGTQHEVQLSSAHDAPLVNNGTSWAKPATATGLNVYFPNVTIGGGTTTVTAGGAIGEGDVPIAANTFTYVTIVGQ